MPTLRGTWEAGNRVIKAIGFDSTEDHRTYSDGGSLSICNEKGLPSFGERYRCWYPLRDWGINRVQCGEIIRAAGLPVPPKSACFFCPAMRLIEIEQLKKSDPDLHLLAVEMESQYRSGRHFRGDSCYTVRAKHKLTGEKIETEVSATTDAEARGEFRRQVKDTARPFQWDVRVSRSVVGLGRSFEWGKA